MYVRVLCLLVATVFNNANQQINVYGDEVEVDYRGYEVGGVGGRGQGLAVLSVCIHSVILVSLDHNSNS